jgi:hypothetical protein
MTRFTSRLIVALLAANLIFTVAASHIATRAKIASRDQVAASINELSDAEMVKFSILAKMIDVANKTCRPGSVLRSVCGENCGFFSMR